MAVLLNSAGKKEYKGSNNLVDVVIADGVTEIGYGAFENCTNLTSITIPGSVTEIGVYAFSHCSALTSITIPGSVAEIGEEAFWHCEDLTEVNIPSREWLENCNTADRIFNDCENLEYLTCKDGEQIPVPENLK